MLDGLKALVNEIMTRKKKVGKTDPSPARPDGILHEIKIQSNSGFDTGHAGYTSHKPRNRKK